MLTPSLIHMHLFDFNATYNLGSNGSTKIQESLPLFQFLLEGHLNTSSRMSCIEETQLWLVDVFFSGKD